MRLRYVLVSVSIAVLITSYSGKSHALNASNFVCLDSSADIQTQFHVTTEFSFVLIVMVDIQTQFHVTPEFLFVLIIILDIRTRFHVKPEFSFLLIVMVNIQTQFHIIYSTLIFIPLECNGRYPN